MSILGGIVAGAIREHGRKTIRRQQQRWEIGVDEFGPVDVSVELGDIDGSGEAPGVQLEFRHDFGGGAFAMSGREAELLGRALIQAGGEIAPHERLKASRVKWRRTSIQPKPPTDEEDTQRL